MIVSPATSIAKNLARLLEGAGHKVEIDSHYTAHPDVVISLLGLNSVQSTQAAQDVLIDHFKLARTIAFDKKIKGFIVVENIDGHLGLKNNDKFRAYLGGCAGLLKTASQEWEANYFKLIDIATDEIDEDGLVQHLYQEITHGNTHLEVCISADGHLSPTLTKKPIQHIDKNRLNKESVIIVSGGARGITAACIIGLAKMIPCTFILLGRSQLVEEDEETISLDEESMKKKLIEISMKSSQKMTPKEINQKIQKILASRELKHTLHMLHSSGAKAQYVICDIADKESVRKAVEDIRQRYGKIDGVIHGAGVLEDKLIKDKTDEQFAMVFNTKVNGYENLIAATQQDALKLIAIFSSVAARFGNKGQVDYAMANETLNKLAQYEQHKRGKNCLVKAINWGPWEGGMVNKNLKELFTSRGIALIPLDEGVNAFINEVLDVELDSVEVVIGSKLGKEYV